MDEVKQGLVIQARTLRKQLEALEARISAIESDDQVSRRGLFRKLGAAAAGGVVLAVGSTAFAPTAHADNGDPLIIGAAGNTTTKGTYLQGDLPAGDFYGATLVVDNYGVGPAIRAMGHKGPGVEANGAGYELGLSASSINGDAIKAYSSSATGLVSSGHYAGHGVLGFAGDSGNAVFGVHESGSGDSVVGLNKSTGRGVFAVIDNPSSKSAALESISNADSWALRVLSQHTTTTSPSTEIINYGQGPALLVREVAANAQNALRVSAAGTGSGVYATSTSGRGGTFQGPVASVRLMPGKLATYPKTGSIGDLYVDTTGRLWFCKKTGNPATWKQIA
jgi:hypothetical protein